MTFLVYSYIDWKYLSKLEFEGATPVRSVKQGGGNRAFVVLVCGPSLLVSPALPLPTIGTLRGRWGWKSSLRTALKKCFYSVLGLGILLESAGIMKLWLKQWLQVLCKKVMPKVDCRSVSDFILLKKLSELSWQVLLILTISANEILKRSSTASL